MSATTQTVAGEPSEPPSTGASSTGSDDGPQRGAAEDFSAPSAAGLAAGSCEIQLQNPQRRQGVSARALRPWLERVVATVEPRAESLVVRFVGDREIRRLNATWRGVDAPTDVLSFPGDLRHPEAPAEAPDVAHDDDAPSVPPALEDARHLGDIVISVPTARRQAAAGGFDGAALDGVALDGAALDDSRTVGAHSLERELRLLILHGLLHCLGFDHERDGGSMERVEATMRRRFLGTSPAEPAS